MPKKHEKITLFKTDLYAKKLDIDHTKIIKYLKKLEKDAIKVTASNYGGWHSHYYFDPFPSCVEPLNKEINKFMKQTIHKDFDIRGDLCVHNSWFIINKKVILINHTNILLTLFQELTTFNVMITLEN